MVVGNGIVVISAVEVVVAVTVAIDVVEVIVVGVVVEVVADAVVGKFGWAIECVFRSLDRSLQCSECR